MKATGIVRRIDDLGRVVIPKEIRRNMNIREGDPLEIFIEDGGVVFKKYSLLSSFAPQAAHIQKVLSINGISASVFDNSSLLCGPLIYVDYTSMPYKVYRHKNFFEKLVDKIGNR